MNKIAIVIPTYNELENIESLLLSISKFLPNSDVFIIDDTKKNEIQKLIIKKRIKVNYFHRKKSIGRGSAVLFGLKKALKKKKYKIFIEMDADHSHNPNELKKNIDYFKKKKLDLLIASRYLSKSKIYNWSIQRRIFSKLANLLAKIFLQIKISDYTNGFRIYSRKATKTIIKDCGNIGDGFIVLSEILLKIHQSKLKIDEIHSIFTNRVRGESSVNISLILQSFFGLIKLFLIKTINK